MKRVLSFILCLAMVLSMSAGVFANTDDKYVYVSIGSSQTMGFGLSGYMPEQFSKWYGTADQIAEWETKSFDADAWNPVFNRNLRYNKTGYSNYGLFTVVNGSLGTNIRDYLSAQGYNVDFRQLAAAGMRAQDLIVLLDEMTVIDEYTEYNLLAPSNIVDMATDLTGDEALATARAIYQKALKEANLITYDLGCGDFTAPILASLIYGVKLDLSNVLSSEEYAAYSAVKSCLENQVKTILSSYISDMDNAKKVDFISNMVDLLAYSIFGYIKCFDKTMAWIKDNNSAAKVVVTQIQNMSAGMVIEYGGVTLPLGDLIQILVDMANSYASSFSPYSTWYYYARITDNQRVSFFLDDIAAYTGPECLNDDIKTLLDAYERGCDFHTKSMLTPIYEDLGRTVEDGQVYTDTLTACYDGMMRILQHIYTSDYHGTRSADYANNTGIVLKGIANQMYTEIASSVVAGKDYEEAIFNALQSLDDLSVDVKKDLVMYMYSGCANSAFNHPNREGYAEMTSAVINALDTGNTGVVSVLKGLRNTKNDFRGTSAKIQSFVKSYAQTLVSDTVNKVSDTIRTNVENTVTSIKANIKKEVNKQIGIIVKKVISQIM